MVRRVTRTKAHIFVATKMAANAHIKLFSGSGVRHDASGPIATGTPAALNRIGEHLFVGVLSIDIPASAAPGSTVSYDVVINDGTERGLNALELLGGAHVSDARRRSYPLGFEDGVLPSFVLPPSDPADLQIVHGSCRKPHGGGEKEPDAFQLMDASIAAALRGDADASPRPQQLILTGDQIYADDVAPALLQSLTAAGDELLGWDEDLPAVTAATSFIVQPGWRTRYLSLRGADLKDLPEDDQHDYSQSHLLRFGEWVAMYLFAWSDALWPLDQHGAYDLPAPASRLPLATLEQAIGIADTIGLVAVPARAARALEIAVWLSEFGTKLQEMWTATRKQALRYGKSVRTTRRVLANVATYTMFDDHEITDDWYVSKRVHDELKGTGPISPQNQIGPRLLRNGLSAYAIFQHWGNVPEDFAAGTHGADLLSKWRFVSRSTGCELKNTPRSADTILGITPGDSTIPAARQRGSFDRFRWDYTIEFPGHRLMGLDTRTWRFFPPGAPLSFSDLAPLLPVAQGTPAQAGAARIRAIADGWRQAGAAASVTTMQHFADLVEAYVDLAEQRDANLAQLRTSSSAYFTAVFEFFDSLPHRVALAGNLEDPVVEILSDDGTIVITQRDIIDFLRNLSLVEFSGDTVDDVKDRLREVFDMSWQSDLGPNADQLSDALEALGDYVAFAWQGSVVGMVHAARRFAINAGADLWSIFTSQAASGTVFTQLGAALVLAIDALDQLAEATGLEEFARRIFRDGSNRLAPGLIRQDALEFMVSDPLQGADVAKPTFILSPAPIFGNRLVEAIQRMAVIHSTASGEAGEEELDFEPWTGNTEAMINLFSAAERLRVAVVLSGDVHYAGSSVVDVAFVKQAPGETPSTRRVSTRYIQLTSSSMRNSDSKTRGLGTLDDLLHGANNEIRLFQADWAGFAQTGSASAAHLQRIARAEVEEFLEGLNPVDSLRDTAADLEDWWNGPQINANDVFVFGRRAVEALPNSAIELTTEGIFQFYHAIENVVELADDPMMKIFGDYLTAPAPLLRHLHHFYQLVGLDPANGLMPIESVLKDRRVGRLPRYPTLASRVSGSPRRAELIEHQERRTVGHANAGYISLAVRNGQIREVRHELRWYPFDEAARVANHQQDPIPRLDWIGTLHRAGWHGNQRDPARYRP